MGVPKETLINKINNQTWGQSAALLTFLPTCVFASGGVLILTPHDYTLNCVWISSCCSQQRHSVIFTCTTCFSLAQNRTFKPVHPCCTPSPWPDFLHLGPVLFISQRVMYLEVMHCLWNPSLPQEKYLKKKPTNCASRCIDKAWWVFQVFYNHRNWLNYWSHYASAHSGKSRALQREKMAQMEAWHVLTELCCT